MARVYVGPWVWESPAGSYGFWRAPTGALAAVDLRSIPDQATQGPTPSGSGFFVVPDAVTLDSAYVEVPETFTGQARARVRAALGLSQTILSGGRRGLLLELLIRHAVVDGSSFCRPIMPTRRGRIRLRDVDDGDLEHRIGDTASPFWATAQEMLHAEYRRWRTAVLSGDMPAEFHRRWLTVQVERFGGQIGYQAFIPSDLPDETPLPHQTTLTESFNKADSDTLGPDQTWSELAGDYDVVGNRARVGTTASVTVLAQVTSDLSSSNQYAQASVHPAPANLDNGPAARAQSGPTGYIAIARSVEADLRLFKLVSDSYTQLGSTFGNTWAGGEVLRVEADGSSITAKEDSVTRVGPITDTAIASGTRAGIWSFSGGLRGDLDNWEAADLAPGGLSLPIAYHHRQRMPQALLIR